MKIYIVSSKNIFPFIKAVNELKNAEEEKANSVKMIESLQKGVNEKDAIIYRNKIIVEQLLKKENENE